MKNLFPGILALALVLGMTVVGCDNGSTDDNGNKPQTTKYESADTNGNTYSLVITENTSRYTAKKDDTYVLTIKKSGQPDKKSKGTVSVVGADGTLTLQPETANAPSFAVSTSGTKITAFSGPITLDDGEALEAGEFNGENNNNNNNNSNNGTSSDFNYTEENGTITITGYTGTGGNVTIPAQINGKPVVNIRWAAFEDCTSLTGVTIPNSVTSIGWAAFQKCTSLTSVNIPNSVTSISGQAFQYCTSLTSITIPDSVTSIGDRAFSHSGLTSVTIGNSVTYIGNSTFYVCDSLTSITIPDSVTSIGEDAFAHCYRLTSITIPDSVTSIGNSAFLGCSLTNVTIPNSVTYIGYQAFCNCSLTSITIPNSVTVIGGEAFSVSGSGSGSLTSVTFQGTITADNFGSFNLNNNNISPFYGDLRAKYLAGGIGTYTRPNTSSSTWTKQ